MKRKNFLKTLGLTAVAGVVGTKVSAQNEDKASSKDEQVGFNHLPNKEEIKMNKIIHRANTRGHANHGWLDTYHTFSFANYRNPERMNFGVLRVLNDDTIGGGRGFGTHPHDNMEIISIPLEGALEHKDSMGNTAVIKAGEVQVMSAGTGVYHSEYNKYGDREGKFLQIWLFPNKRNVDPRYDQISLDNIRKENRFYQILSPYQDDQGVWIHQNAWFHLGEFDAHHKDTYSFKTPQSNGLYIFVLEGEVEVGGETLTKRDGMGVWAVNELEFAFNDQSKVLLMEVPLRM